MKGCGGVIESLAMNKKLISNLLLLLTAVIWGVAFVAQSKGTDHLGPWSFVFFRYLVSSVVMIPVSWAVHRKIVSSSNAGGILTDNSFETKLTDGSAGQRPAGKGTAGRATCDAGRRSAIKKTYITGGVSCGLFLGIASLAQQAGIQYTTAGKAGFITALYVVLVPVYGLFFHKKPEKKIWLCVALGLVGLYLISVNDGFHIESGDALVMLCAAVFACQIMCVDHFSPKVTNIAFLANIQFVTVAIISFAGMVIWERPAMENVMAAAIPILYAGVLSGAAGYTLQMVAQKNTDPAVASLLMSLESVFSALAGWAILGQILTFKELLGCAAVMAAVVLAQIPSRRKSG